MVNQLQERLDKLEAWQAEADTYTEDFREMVILFREIKSLLKFLVGLGNAIKWIVGLAVTVGTAIGVYKLYEAAPK